MRNKQDSSNTYNTVVSRVVYLEKNQKEIESMQGAVSGNLESTNREYRTVKPPSHSTPRSSWLNKTTRQGSSTSESPSRRSGHRVPQADSPLTTTWHLSSWGESCSASITGTLPPH
jgi:hypothetical protein